MGKIIKNGIVYCGGGNVESHKDWTVGTLYNVGDVVIKDDIKIQCIADHTSTDFETDSTNWVVVLEQYYHVTQEQYNKMVSDGLITDSTKDLYIIDGNSEGGNSSSANYTSLDELGLTAPITVGEIFNVMSDNTMAVLGCENTTDHITDVPTAYGVLTIKKKNNSRFSIDYQNSLGGSATNVKKWIGTLKGTDGTGLYWKEIQTEVGVVITSDTITKYGTEILKYPVGTWRIESLNLGKQFTDLPYAEMAGIIEIDSIQPNKSPYEHAYGYRTYTFTDALNSIVYTRTLNSGNTVGTIQRDSGWCTTGSHFYKLSQMYLSASATIQDVIDKLPIGCTAILRTDEFTNWSTLFNGIQWGYLKVEKTVNGLSNIELQEVLGANRRYFGTQSSGKFDRWIYDRAKVTATFNSKTFKIDITKGNENWNGNMKFGYCVDESYGEIIISSLGKTEVMWDCSTGVRYVKSVTYTIDPDNKAHVTIGVELYDTVYGIHQLETCGDFATINSFTADAFTGTSVAKRGATRGRNNGVGMLCDVADLELTKPCTTVQIAQAMRHLTNSMNRIPRSGMIGIFDNDSKTITDTPSSYGILQISAYGYDRLMIRYDGIASSSYEGSWIGKIKGSNGTFSSIEWERIDGVVSTGGEPAVYSTSEQAIGTWVDGKTIYRKTIVKDSHSVNAQLISGVDTFIRGYGTCERAGYVYNVPHCGLLAGHLQDEDIPYLNFKLDTSGALSTIGSSTYTISKLKVTLEYTKK